MRNKKEIVREKDFEFAKVPPSDYDLEKVVLGAIMLEKTAFELVNEVIHPDCFYSTDNKSVYESMVNLARANQPIDVMTVIHQLKEDGKYTDSLGAAYVVKLTNSVVSSANIEHHARILLMLSQRREMIRISGISMSEAYDDTKSITEIFQDHDISFTRIQNAGAKENTQTSETILIHELSRLQELRKNDSHITGIPSGFKELDRLTHGWQNSDLVVIAARPSMGKTAFALRLLRNASQNEYKPVPAIFFSLEMSSSQLIKRLLSAESGVLMGSLVSGRLTDGEMDSLTEAAGRLAKLPLYFDDTPSIGIMELKSKVRKYKRKHNIGIVIIDYIQLMQGDTRSGSREQEISSISRNLKALGKELNIPIIALSQLSREVEKRNDKTPQLSDLRESGAIEQDADMVAFIYRPEYYNVVEDHNGESTSGLTEIKIAKHRNGSLDTIKLRADLAVQKFYDWDVFGQPAAAKGFKTIQSFTQSEAPF